MPRLKSKATERKYRKRPNGAGTVTKLSGNRRKPFVAKLTATRNVLTGEYKQTTLGTFETFELADKALDLYYFYQDKEISKSDIKKAYPEIHKSIVKLESTPVPTFKEIYEILREEKFQYEASVSSKDSWFNNFKIFHNCKVDTISFIEMQNFFDDLKDGASEATLLHMKSLLNKIFKYAVRYDYISREDNFVVDIDTSISKNKTSTDNKRTTRIFTIEEIKKLLGSNNIAAKTVLLFLFTGTRPNELLNLDRYNIFLDVETEYNGEKHIIDYMITGSKTDAGKDRIVPIHPIIKPIILEFLKLYNYKTLFIPDTIKKNRVHYYRDNLFKEAMNIIGEAHIPYDCRHTFITLADEYGVNPTVTKRIVGHKMKDITYDIYTHTVKNKLYNEICKISIL